jgi:hypothetical protein
MWKWYKLYLIYHLFNINFDSRLTTHDSRLTTHDSRLTMTSIKFYILFIILALVIVRTSDAQLKEAAQLATLTPAAFVLSSDNIISAHKLHFTASTMLYLSSYLVTESYWKAAVISLLIGAAKELIYDGLLNMGEPWIQDMKWNTLGVAQGAVFTLSLKL